MLGKMVGVTLYELGRVARWCHRGTMRFAGLEGRSKSTAEKATRIRMKARPCEAAHHHIRWPVDELITFRDFVSARVEIGRGDHNPRLCRRVDGGAGISGDETCGIA
jgi:hypothetical protein